MEKDIQSMMRKISNIAISFFRGMEKPKEIFTPIVFINTHIKECQLTEVKKNYIPAEGMD